MDNKGGKTMHYEPLRPNRMYGSPEPYEFTHGDGSVCVYDRKTLDFVKEIKVGTKPDCHAVSGDGRYLYIACFEGLYCIGIESLEVEKIVDTGKIYATNVLPDGNTLLVHDLEGGVQVIENINDMEKIRVAFRTQVLPERKFRSEIGGKGNFIDKDRFYLCAGWRSAKLYLLDAANNFEPSIFIDYDERLSGSDDLVLSHDKKRAYTACHRGNENRAYVAVIDVEKREILKLIPTGVGSCGLTMTCDERYVIASNDGDDSISVIDTVTDEVVNTPCAREGFEKLGITGYIQGISCDTDDSIYVYGCYGNGAIVRFTDIVNSNSYEISCPTEKYSSK